ncbi:MAG: hypothetical protein E3J37_00290 [Anaerolineales bacterium]|nr:MAG: hypothetical protein E3J37_00290 [Anaerolineales bacterium]
MQCRMPASEAAFVGHAVVELAGTETLGVTTIAFIRDDEKVIADYTIDRFPELFDLLVQNGGEEREERVLGLSVGDIQEGDNRMVSRLEAISGSRLKGTNLVFTILIVASFAQSCVPKSTPTPTATTTLTPSPRATATPIPTMTSVADLVATPFLLGSRDVTNFTFVVCGDVRQGVEVYAELLRRVEAEDVAFLVNTGDLVERGRERNFQAFAEIMSDFSLPFFPVAGNHDTEDGFLDVYLQYSGAPAAHYSFDYGLGHFVITDNHLGIMSPSELSWLEADLAATDQPLRMVFLHHPPFDPRGQDSIFHGGNEQFMALMKQYGVSFVFAGHIHSYLEETRDGVHYVITGGAGAPINPDDFYHYVRVTVVGNDVSTEVVKVEPPEGEGK